jgi:hypothetical protein
MDTNNLTPEDSFKIIDKAISNFKMNYRESAKVFLLWGWILALASLSNFIILIILKSGEAYSLMGIYSLINWVVVIIIGFIAQFFVLRDINKDKKVHSHLEGYIRKLWIVSAAAFFLAGFLCIQLGIDPPAIMLLIAGIATTTSGLLIKFKPLIIGGISFFVFSIASTFVSNEYIALIVCAAIICGYLIPGYFLKSAKEQVNVQ